MFNNPFSTLYIWAAMAFLLYAWRFLRAEVASLFYACLHCECIVLLQIPALNNTGHGLHTGHAGALHTSGERLLPAVRAQVPGGGRPDIPGRCRGVSADTGPGIEAGGLMCPLGRPTDWSWAAGQTAGWAGLSGSVSYLVSCTMVGEALASGPVQGCVSKLKWMQRPQCTVSRTQCRADWTAGSPELSGVKPNPGLSFSRALARAVRIRRGTIH